MNKIVKIWDLSNKSYIEEARFVNSKNESKKIIKQNVNIINNPSLIIKQDFEVVSGKHIDFLTIDKNANISIIQTHFELNPSDIIHRLIDYASILQQLTYNNVKELYEKTNKQSFEKAVKEHFGQFQSDFNKHQYIILVSNSLSITFDKTFQYLTDKFKLPINVVTFELISNNNSELLIQNWYRDPQQFFANSFISTEKETLMHKGQARIEEFKKEQVQNEDRLDNISENLESLLEQLKASCDNSVEDSKDEEANSKQTNEVSSIEDILQRFFDDIDSKTEQTNKKETDDEVENLLKSYFQSESQTTETQKFEEEKRQIDLEKQQIEEQKRQIEIEKQQIEKEKENIEKLLKHKDEENNEQTATPVEIEEIKNLIPTPEVVKVVENNQNKQPLHTNKNAPKSWDKAYELGISEIDNQHKILFSIYDEFVNAYNTRESIDLIQSLLERLDSFRIFHFESEENLMLKLNYDDFEQHVKEHQFFAKTIADFIQLFKYGNKSLISEIILFLKKWFISHINGSDMMFKNFIEEHGYDVEKINSLT